ncbi:MAG: hypothetical protein LC104_16750 [Bacteroidales bacterium]|nr:hypothetical protein [Bacteroidales bacterium]
MLRKVAGEGGQRPGSVAVDGPLEGRRWADYQPLGGVPGEVRVIFPQRRRELRPDLGPHAVQQRPEDRLELDHVERGVRLEDVVDVDFLLGVELLEEPELEVAVVLPANVVAEFVVERAPAVNPVPVRRWADHDRVQLAVRLGGDLPEPPVEHRRHLAGLEPLADATRAPGVRAGVRGLEEVLRLAKPPQLLAFSRSLGRGVNLGLLVHLLGHRTPSRPLVGADRVTLPSRLFPNTLFSFGTGPPVEVASQVLHVAGREPERLGQPEYVVACEAPTPVDLGNVERRVGPQEVGDLMESPPEQLGDFVGGVEHGILRRTVLLY